MTVSRSLISSGGLPPEFAAGGSASFSDFLEARPRPAPLTAGGASSGETPHATTIVALATAGGVVMAGDRRATAGSMIAHRAMEKVFPADTTTAVGIAGTAGLALEMVRLYQVELEHYEKIEGSTLSLEGKANRLATMVRGNLGSALQGLAAVPLLAGYDERAGVGRIYSYDVTGGRYLEDGHHAIGSGSVFARGSLKKRWRAGLGDAEAVEVAIEALVDAADDDSATGGPDTLRRLWPVVAVVDAGGYRRVGDADLSAATEAVTARRRAALDADDAVEAARTSGRGERS